MKTMKRVCALLLAFSMVLSVGTVGVSAATENDLLTTDFSLAISEVDKTLTVALNCSKDISGFNSGSGDMSIKDSSGNDVARYFTLTAITAGELLDMTKVINTSHWGASAEDYENGDSMEAGTWVTYTYTVSDVIPDDTYTFTMTLGDDFSDIEWQMYSCNEGVVTANYVVGNPAEDNSTGYEIYYTLDKSGENDDAFKDHEVTDQVTAEIFLVSNEADVTVQAYDIYLTYDDGLVFNELDGMDGKPYTADAADVTDVAEQGDKVAHIQLVANTTTYSLEKGKAQSLGKVVFDFAEDAVYGVDYKISLTDGEDQEDVTNIAIGGETEGDKKSYYPVTIDTIDGVTYSGAEIVTKYDVTFDTDGGSTVVAQEVGHNLFAEKPEDPSKANHTFAGWYTDDTFATEFVFNATKITEDTVIYAKWTKNTVTITWKNGNTVLDTNEIDAGNAPSYTGATPTKDADAQYTYTFAGWSATDGGAKLDTLPAATENAIYYAVFSTVTNKYTVTWYDDEGNVLRPDENVEYGTTPSYGSNPSKAETAEYTYTFAGWSATKGGDVLDPLPPVDGPEAYYAIFTAEKQEYEVTYDAGEHGTLEGDTGETVKYGENPTTAPAVKPADGYTFTGWSNGTTTSDKLTDFEIEDTTTLTAQYEAVSYKITLDPAGGAVADGKTNIDYTIESTDMLPAATKTGYAFNGWKLETTVDGWEAKTYAANTAVTGKWGNVTLVAQWVEDAHDVKQSGDVKNGEATPDENSAKEGDTVTVTVTPAEGYKFDEEKNEVTYTYTDADDNKETVTIPVTDDDGDGVYTGTFEMPDYAVEINATFTAINYTVEVTDPANGTVTATPTTAIIGTEITLTNAPDDGYQWVSYKVTNDNTQEEITVNDGKFTMPASNVTVTATFTGKTYTINYDSNGGTGTTYSTPVTFGTAATLAENAFTKTGYKFKGWSTATNGEVVTTFNPETYAEEYTLYAVWEAKKVNVTLDYSYEGKDDEVIEVTYDGAYSNLPAAEREGYTFAGWYDGKTLVTQETKVNKDTEHTLTAKWDLITYTITYEENGGTTVADGTYNVTTSVTLPTEITRAGYEFKGWYETADFTDNATTAISVGTTGNKTYYAKWEALKYTITFVVGENGQAIDPVEYDINTDITLPAAVSTSSMYTFKEWKIDQRNEGWMSETYNAGVIGSGHYGNVTLTAVWSQTVKYEVEEYKYAYDGWYLLRVKDTFATDTTQTYKFGEEVMYYTTDENYRIDADDAGAFYLLVSASDLNQEKLNSATDKALELTAEAYAKIKPATAERAIIDYNGDINDDTILNIADANIVYQMVEQASEGNYYSMDQLKNDRRLEADMAKGTTDEGNLHRASIADVHAIVNLINKAN